MNSRMIITELQLNIYTEILFFVVAKDLKEQYRGCISQLLIVL
jgi:hypothetical protein